MHLSREAATAKGAAHCCRRFAAWVFLGNHFLRADARSYLLRPLRGQDHDVLQNSHAK
jgi:hypothetical protein